MKEVIIDALLDSLKIFAVVVVFQYIIALIEPKLSEKISLKGKLAPLIGVSISLLPQCGFSVVATDLYQKRHITVGTLIGVYIATSDEALPIFLGTPDKALHVLPLIALKFVLGLAFGYIIDLVLSKSRKKVEHHVAHCNENYKIKLTDCDGAELVENKKEEKTDCCCDECKECEEFEKETNNLKQQEKDSKMSDKTENSEKKDKIDRFLIHPLLHSLEIFAYVLVVNLIFGIIVNKVGEENLITFLTSNKYLAPLLAVIVGAIPNCVSSVVISELYIMGGLGFGATLGGLCMNAGVAFVYLFKDVKHTKRNLAVFGAMFAISLVIGYIFSLAFSFSSLNF